MRRYILRRLAQGVLVVWGIGTIIFVVTHVVGDPVAMMLPMDATMKDYDALKHNLGLDRPLFIQYGIFVRDIAQGDMGHSFRWRRPALKLVLERMPATGQLAGAAIFITVIFAVPFGMISALRPGSLLDKGGRTIAILGQAMPPFWVGLLLMLVFAVYWRIFPVAGRGTALHLVLPAVTLAWFSMAVTLRLTRSAMLDVLGQDYILMARLKGLPTSVVLFRHALKNAGIPVLTLVALQLGRLLGGAIVVETIFSWPGVGKLTFDAVNSWDFSVVQTAVLIGSVIFVFINLLVDILYAWLDPRIRFA